MSKSYSLVRIGNDHIVNLAQIAEVYRTEGKVRVIFCAEHEGAQSYSEFFGEEAQNLWAFLDNYTSVVAGEVC
jgi:hypothetical protein